MIRTADGPTIIVRAVRVFVCVFTKADGSKVDVYTDSYELVTK